MSPAERADLGIVIEMVGELRREMTSRFDSLDEREGRQDERIAAIETRDAVAAAVARSAAEAAAASTARHQIRYGRLTAALTVAGTLIFGIVGIALRLLHL